MSHAPASPATEPTGATSSVPDAPPDAELRDLLGRARTVAVLGASNDPHKPAHEVPAYLRRRGYEVIPVNPLLAGEELVGTRAVATLAELSVPIDIVDVFRRAEAIPAHVDDILAMAPLPGVVWLQLGIRNDDVAERLRSAGITVIQDRCIKIEHARLHKRQER